MNQPTIQLYNQESHMQTFEASVLTCTSQSESEPNQESTYLVTLDSTAFFPVGGGQPADAGTIDNILVLDVQEKDNIIYHTLSAPIEVGKLVIGQLDWKKRFDLMQHHSAEHIISGIVHKNYGYDNVGFHMGSEAITVDFNGNLTESDIRKIEFEANQAVYLNLPIQTTFPTKEELQTLEYRSKKELSGNIRIVTIPGIDICACCAPHVYLTGEIGGIKITSSEKYKGGVRISMLCGNRAIEDYNRKENSVTAISVLLSSKPDNIREAVKSLKDETITLKGQISALFNQLLYYKVQSIPEGTDSIVLFDPDIEPNYLRAYSNLLVQRCSGICAVFLGSDETGYKYILASKSTDVSPIGKQLNEAFSGKGGGSKEMVQGSVVGTKDSLEIFLSKLCNI